MDNKLLILIVEDEDTINNFIASMLSSNDYQYVKARSGAEALAMAASEVPDLILLDMGLPDIDGSEVIQKLRSWSSVPIIVVSARGHEQEKVKALDLGADDYVTKPFGTHELLARIRTALRHSNNRPANSEEIKQLNFGQLHIDLERRLVTLAGSDVHFTPIEYKILVLLARNAGKVLTHDFIIKQVWGPYTNENQALRVNMANIRRKIEKNHAEPKYIRTEVGVGYRMVEN
ncbi:MAG: response regulator transcription factor [Coriobacteriales bacterium]|nr:response regulator transcription factor [Coriobacteriales bacterium]